MLPERITPAGQGHALRWGSTGPRVLLVHGLDGSSANWWNVGAELGADHRALAPDLPGFGRSPLRRRSTRVTAHADHLARLLALDGAGQPATVVGNSLGGVVALALAQRHPRLVRGVVLVAPAVPRAGRAPIDPTMLAAWLALWAPRAGVREVRRRQALPPAERVRHLLELCGVDVDEVDDGALAEMADVAAARNPDEHVRAWTGTARSLWGWLLVRRRFDAAARSVRGPRVLVTGARDPVLPTSSFEDLLRRVPGWEHHELADVAHVPPLEAPDRVAAIVRSVTATAGVAG